MSHFVTLYFCLFLLLTFNIACSPLESIYDASTNSPVEFNVAAKSVTLGVTSAQLVLPNSRAPQSLYNVYGAESFDNNRRVFLGGWKTASDIGADKLYVSRKVAGQFNSPQALRWTNASAKRHYHLNDVSIVKPPSTDGWDRSRWIYMYSTCLFNDGEEFVDQSISTSINWVCLSTSTDNGHTWTFLGPIIRQYNGIDNTGAWAPSAIVRGNQIWLYYHTGTYNVINGQKVGGAKPTRVMRSRINANGVSRIDTRALLWDKAVNVDVEYYNGNYYLVGDSFSPTHGLRDVVLYHSTNGVSFTRYNAGTDVIVRGNSEIQYLSPHLVRTSGNNFKLYFSGSYGRGRYCNQANCTDLQTWDVTLTPR